MVDVMEEVMLVCPDLVEVVSETLLAWEVADVIMGFEDDEGAPEFNIDMPRELNTLLAALRLLDLGVESSGDLSIGGSLSSSSTVRSRDRPLAHHAPIQSPIEGRS